MCDNSSANKVYKVTIILSRLALSLKVVLDNKKEECMKDGKKNM